MFCTFCGKKMDMLSKYCPGCGKKTEKKLLPFIESLFVKTNRLRSKIAKYKVIIDPYYKKTAKYLPSVAGVIIATVLMFSLIIPAYGRRMFEIGRERIGESRYNEAVAAFSQARIAGIRGSELNAFMGEAFINLGEFDRALEHLSDTEGEITPIKLRLLADVWAYEGNGQMYANTLRDLINLVPNDPYAYLRLAAHYREEGLFENAAGVLERLLARQRNAAAQGELYNIFMESFVVNSSLERAALIRQDAMRALSSAYIESLDVGDAPAVSLSPGGRYVAVYAVHSGRSYMDIYEIRESEFRLSASFRLPPNYIIDYGMIAWSPDESMVAFFNSGAEEFVSDSSIFIGNIEENRLYNLTDPGADFVRYMGSEGVYIIDSLPAFSEDSARVYFARRTLMGNWLAVVDIDGENMSYLFEPPSGGFVEYKIIERGGRVFFSVAGPLNNPLWGIYIYENGEAHRLDFEYDNRLYYLALKDITADGQFMLYYLTVASQNDSMLFGVINLDTMAPVNIYNQELDIMNERIVAINRSNIFGTYRPFITRNAAFSADGRSLVVAEDGGAAYGKIIRRFPLANAGSVGSFVYISFDTENAGNFSVPRMNKSGIWFREVRDGEFLVYDNGFRLLRAGGM
ncbi:MAG: hypothetical protein FWE24_09795 [Defluviitaleaceae bacterium]|nr:hypothetical protein [Defluviitaleaceae bacterium]